MTRRLKGMIYVADADKLATIPVTLGGVLVEIALIWFEQGNDEYSWSMSSSSPSPMTMATLLLPIQLPNQRGDRLISDDR